jgi:hypothetical protein
VIEKADYGQNSLIPTNLFTQKDPRILDHFKENPFILA